MALLNYKKGKTVSFQGKGEKAKPVSLAQYIMHYAYGASEPTILKTGDILMRGYEGATTEEKREFYKKLMAKMENTSKTGNYFLPHGIILSQKAAENVIDFVYTVEVGAGARFRRPLYLRGGAQEVSGGRDRAGDQGSHTLLRRGHL